MASTLPTNTHETCRHDAIGRPMTRCECTGMTFDEAARIVAAEGLTAPELTRRTGCGGNCTACLPDLLRHLASRRS